MKQSHSYVLVVFALFFILFPSIIRARHICQLSSHHGHHHHRHTTAQLRPKFDRDDHHASVGAEPSFYWGGRPRGQGRLDTVDIAGSRLPDCSHACGSCSPCRLVMVSFVCAWLQEAETCPMAYKCMCNNRSYPVP